ncbi:RNA-directed DNA polymerase [Pseudoalteromonas luteoviolacea]|uniref:reverse transcriptase family protein n=1 Tax=Pseudoalteromonas luteoviolacea TaxID=43657 RepID=UPI001B3906C1|nr:RNA-directed DNA polymerase [Pseudoalteromonas luteoviolacea]
MKKNQKSKLKIQLKNKSYQVKDSPFYKLATKRKLANLLNISVSELLTLTKDAVNYKVFSQSKGYGKQRVIQKPIGRLEYVHTRIASLLCRVSVPSFVHSGRKGHSHVTNAKQHLGNNRVLTTDIKNFFPSTTEEMVFKLFFHTFKMNGDVAKLLANLCCFSGHVPTGSRVSMPISFWSNSKMFDELSSLSTKHDVVMSLYVDDLTFSGDGINRLFLSTVRKIVQKHGHIMHPDKTKVHTKNSRKVITGVVVQGDTLNITNKQNLMIYRELAQWKVIKNLPFIPKSLESRLLGRLYAMGQIDKKYKDKAMSVRNSS